MDNYYNLLLFALIAAVCCVRTVRGQEGFTEEIECYACYDRAENTTCGDGRDTAALEALGRITCKRGACVKFTLYRNHVLMMRRTCSMQININIHLGHVCRTERYNNGYLCMCNTDYCNGAPLVTSLGVSPLLALATVLVSGSLT